MKIALIGATGFVGTALLKEFLNRGNEVIALARGIDKITIEDAKLTKQSVDVGEVDRLSQLLKGADVVVSAYNPGWTNPNIHEDILKGTKAIQKAVEQSGVKRFLMIGGAGTLQINGNYLVDGPQFPKEIYPAASAVKKYFVDELKPSTTLDWTFFSPAIEMHQGITTGRTGKYRLGTDSPVFNEEGRSVLSVEDLAIAIADELENKKFHRQQFTAAY